MAGTTDRARASDSPERGRGRKIFVISAAAIVTIIALAGVGVWALVVAPTRATYRRLSRELADGVADFHAQRWTRPVLRGGPIDGNAFEAQERSIARFGVLPEVEMSELGALIRDGAEPSEAARALIARRGDALAEYRRTTQYAWSWGDYAVEDGFRAEEMEYIPHLRATRLLLAAARGSSPAECVPMALDAIRLGQDRSAGRSLVGLMIAAVGVEEAFGVLPSCLARADDATIDEAARELSVLVAHPAPTGTAMEIEALAAGAMYREVLGPLTRLPHDADDLRAWVSSGDTLDAWERVGGDPAERRHIGERYPGDIADQIAWQTSLSASGNAVLADAVPSFERYLRRDAAVRSRVVMLWALSRLLAGEPRSILGEVDLHDPLTGRPFETGDVGGALELRSVGEDDIHGSGAEGHTDDLLVRVSRDAPAPPHDE